MSNHGGKADKKGGHTVRSVSIPGIPTGALKKPAYSVQATAAPANTLGPAGTKGLMMRAKKVLAPLEDPTQAITN